VRNSLDRSRIAAFYAAHAVAARRLAYLLTGDQAEAEDLVQDAFVRVAMRLADLRDPARFPSYLNRTLVTMSASRHRRRRRERLALQRFVPARPQVEVVAESTDLVWETLQALPTRQRAAIVLRFYQDLTEDQISETMGCPRGTVKSLIFRGLKSMKKSLGGDVSEATATSSP
jgi:RNA polymerase sigma-70 factor (sigma-E family)